MSSRRHTADTIIRYAIGASVLLLGLMAFSALFWFTCSLCGVKDFLWSIGFWEIVGAGAISFFAVAFLRSYRRKKRKNAMSKMEDEELPASTRRESISSSLRGHRDNWRSLYAQLSRDEREKLKAMVEKYCADDEAITRPAASGSEDSHSR